MAVTGIAVVAAIVVAANAEAGAADSQAGQAVLSNGSIFRYYVVTDDPVAVGDEEPEDRTRRGTPWPPEHWRQPEFDDHRWSRTRSPEHICAIPGGRWGRPRLALLCTRSRFEVADPAAVRDLRLSLGYRGGVVVYLNGTEIGRGHIGE